ncbi:probable multidrug resistance-associated protein lethal(2)03659 [Photinus pyralis]|uniref:probable multidrug resistance-associated protein lethal(2)03659 n=1 Tax=Photinus pyralis TaxID=7054 RepID=UPI0012673C2B|nr:probable multidrug resistance-associated protein lethal(2)03659 [Photinus pyralis]
MDIKSSGRKQNPKEKINPIFGLLFLHMIPIFAKNYKKGIQEEDLFEPLEEHRSHILGDKLEALWKETHRKYKKFALHISLLRSFGLELLALGILKLINSLLLVYVMPIALGELISYFNLSSTLTIEEASVYTGIIVAYLFIYAIVDHPATMAVMHICMKMRVSCCSLIYRKSLRLSRNSLAHTSVGQIVNLLSNDVSKFDENFLLCPYIIIGPLQSALATYLLYRIIGYAAFAGVTFMVIFVPIQMYLSKWVSVYRLRSAQRTDERVRLMNEILNGIQLIKMYTWEKPFAKLISLARRYEIKSIRIQFFLKALMYSFETFLPRTSIFISLVVFIALGYNITGEIVYSVIAIYNVIRPIMTVFFPLSLAACAEVHTSLGRIEEFLRHEEQEQIESEPSMKPHPSISRRSNIYMKTVCAKWSSESVGNTLTNINLEVSGSKLVAVVGPVGSGKSSIFNLILKELPVTSGDMQVSGKLSYASQDPWLFAASVRENILFGEPYDEKRYKTVVKSCALESDLAQLPGGDRTVVGERGKSLSGGQKARINLARCLYRRADIYLLDDPLSAVDSKVGKHLFEEGIKTFLKDKMCLLITHQVKYAKEADRIIVLKDGRISEEGSYDELITNGTDFLKLVQVNVNDDSGEHENVSHPTENMQMVQSVTGDYDEVEDGEQLTTGSITAATYISYLKAGGLFFGWFIILPAFILTQSSMNVCDYFLSYWVNSLQDIDNFNQTEITEDNDTLYVYGGIISSIIVLGIGHSMLFFIFAMRISVTLHDMVFEKISNATMGFFNENPVGRILNRFSKDMGIIDNYIPLVFSEFLEIILMLFGAMILSVVVNVWLLIPSIGLIFTFYAVRVVYLETSRSVKRIEGITRSPIFTHLTSSVHGLSTIRAFLAENNLIHEFDDIQDHHSSAWYLFISASVAFGFWLDIIANIFISSVIVIILLISEEHRGGDVGLVVTQYVSLTGVLQWGMRQLSELENNMTSVERVLEYNNVPLEPTRKSEIELPAEWPEQGKITFENVSMKYSSNSEPILKQLNFSIYPGEKIGLVGRTGAGKTSTTLALFQLYDITGSILIDDIDTTKIPLDKLRAKLSVIPQDPVLFTGSIRQNLDPFSEYPDDVLWNALEEVELKHSIDESGLLMNVAEGGCNFSVGQRQLVCLARAIIRNQKILIMDEATANVDPYTDNLIQQTIRRRFSNSTVLTIAHRLHTIMDASRVMVFDAGKIVEFDHPHHLLQNKDGTFYSMVQATGQNMFKNLYSIAEKHFLDTKS